MIFIYPSGEAVVVGSFDATEVVTGGKSEVVLIVGGDVGDKVLLEQPPLRISFTFPINGNFPSPHRF